jgi:hypothetical protein
MNGFCLILSREFCPPKSGPDNIGQNSLTGNFVRYFVRGPNFCVFNFVRVLSGILSGRELGLYLPHRYFLFGYN